MAKLALGFCAERPYGKLALDQAGNMERAKTNTSLLKLNNLLNDRCAPRTFFLLGDYLAKSVAAVGHSAMKAILEPQNPLVEIGQHTYSHVTIATIPTRPDKQPVGREALLEEVRKTQDLISDCIGVRPVGLCAPLGYAGGLPDDAMQALSSTELSYVSSDSRDQFWGINPPLVEHGKLRQPRLHASSGLVEIPSHGWQDTAFIGSPTVGTTNVPESAENILAHYRGLLEQAASIEHNGDYAEDVSVALCLHPHAIADYDPNLVVIRGLLDYCDHAGVQLVTYRQIMESIKGT